MKTNSAQIFRKTIPIIKNEISINHSFRYGFMGSCFSQNIADKFNLSGLEIIYNPFGISFNPISIAHHLLEDRYEILKSEGVSYSWQCHSSLFNKTRDELNDLRKCFLTEISNANTVFVTFGSAWVYEHIESGRVVSNCHKQLSQLFNKRLLSVDEIISTWTSVMDKFPKQDFIFTISPVRHWKDGVRENNLSKGILHQAVDALIESEKGSYYPSYEIVMDELRDYRFYAEDMLHPNQLAVDYIWQHFQDSYMQEDTKDLCSRVNQLRSNLNHVPFQIESPTFQAFVERNNQEAAELNDLIGRKVFY